jgi:hypothetical protein
MHPAYPQHRDERPSAIRRLGRQQRLACKAAARQASSPSRRCSNTLPRSPVRSGWISLQSRREPAGFPHHRQVPAAPSEGAERPVRAGSQAVSGGDLLKRGHGPVFARAAKATLKAGAKKPPPENGDRPGPILGNDEQRQAGLWPRRRPTRSGSAQFHQSLTGASSRRGVVP